MVDDTIGGGDGGGEDIGSPTPPAAGKGKLIALINEAIEAAGGEYIKADVIAKERAVSWGVSTRELGVILKGLRNRLVRNAKKEEEEEEEKAVCVENLVGDDVRLAYLLDRIYEQAQGGDERAARLWIEYCKSHTIQEEITQDVRDKAIEAVRRMIEDRAPRYCELCRKLYVDDMHELMQF